MLDDVTLSPKEEEFKASDRKSKRLWKDNIHAHVNRCLLITEIQ